MSRNQESWKIINNDDGSIDYKIEKIFPSKQTVRLELQGDDFGDVIYFNIYLSIAHKRKNIYNTYLQLNGKDGIHTLIWTKKKLMDFEEQIKGDFNEKIIIYCTWDDNRRRNVYERGLIDIGYKIGDIGFGKCLYKIINRSEDNNEG